PWRKPERVGSLLGAEEAEVLVLGDQPREGAVRPDMVRPQLLVKPRPAARKIGDSPPAWAGGGGSGRRQHLCLYRDEHQANDQLGKPLGAVPRGLQVTPPNSTGIWSSAYRSLQARASLTTRGGTTEIAWAVWAPRSPQARAPLTRQHPAGRPRPG